MGDDDTRLRDFGRDVWQRLRDVFIGETMESIPPNSFLVQPQGNGIMIGNLVMSPVKGGVEASDLRQRRKIGKQRADCGADAVAQAS